MKKETKNKIIGYLLIFIPLILISIIFDSFWILLIGIAYSGFDIALWKRQKNQINKNVDSNKTNILITILSMSIILNILLTLLLLYTNYNSHNKKEANCYKLDIENIREQCTNFYSDNNDCDIKISKLQKIYEKQIEKCK